MFVCDTCRREYITKKSLTRHIKERHIQNKHFICTESNCSSKFVRRSYLKTHLLNIHNVDIALAKESSASAILVSNYNNSASATVVSRELEDISDGEEFFENLKSTYSPITEDITDDESPGIYTLIDGVSNDDFRYLTENGELNVGIESGDMLLDRIVGGDIRLSSAVDDDDVDLQSVGGGDVDIQSVGSDDVDSQSVGGSDVGVQSVGSDDVDSQSVGGSDVDSQSVGGSDVGVQSVGGGDVDVQGVDGDVCLYRATGDVLDASDDDDVIIISDTEDDQVPDEIVVSAINVTLYKTERFIGGERVSVSRTSSVGFTENISQEDIGHSLPSIFNRIQQEFNEYAHYYQS